MNFGTGGEGEGVWVGGFYATLDFIVGGSANHRGVVTRKATLGEENAAIFGNELLRAIVKFTTLSPSCARNCSVLGR